ncbi:hypothetical protein ACP70R_038707 [Stipagrostis hirtigluma subsp. patula]
MLAARSLRKASVPPALLTDPSPGSLPTRLAVHVNGAGSSCSAYLASGCRVYKIEICLDGAILSKGKESLLIPDNAQVISSSVVDRCPHRSEIQSVALAEGEGDSCLILGTVDSYGHLIVSRLDTVDDVTSYSVPPRDGVGEGSWAGICFSPVHQSTVAVARQLCKSVDIYEEDIHLRSLHTFLSIWDVRMNNNGGCIQRISGSVGNSVYSVCSSPSGLIATGGTDRTVTVYDPRRWAALSRWVGCSKYEITGLSFSSVDQSFIYVHGVDYEITCGLWKENERAFSFRGDSNWLGFSKCPGTDIVAGWCESGSIFIADARQV